MTSGGTRTHRCDRARACTSTPPSPHNGDGPPEHHERPDRVIARLRGTDHRLVTGTPIGLQLCSVDESGHRTRGRKATRASDDLAATLRPGWMETPRSHHRRSPKGPRTREGVSDPSARTFRMTPTDPKRKQGARLPAAHPRKGTPRRSSPCKRERPIGRECTDHRSGNGVTLTEPRKRIPGGRDRDHRRGGLWGVPTAQGATRTPRQRATAAAKDRP